MATIARNSRAMPAGMQRAYRLEMAGRTVGLLLGLLVLAGVVIFYLGVIAGKAARNPNEPVPGAATQAPEPGASPAAATPQAPAASNALNQALTAPLAPVEGLEKEGAQTAQQTQALVSRAKQELTLQEVPVATSRPGGAAQQANSTPPAPTAPKPGTKTAAIPTAPAHAVARTAPPQAARKTAAPAHTAESYTVQVLSTHEQRSAQELVNQLKRNGFPAYLNQYESADHKIWYRVRVGRTSLSEARVLADKIKKTNYLESAAVLKL